MNNKKIMLLAVLTAFISTSCWGAAEHNGSTDLIRAVELSAAEPCSGVVAEQVVEQANFGILPAEVMAGMAEYLDPQFMGRLAQVDRRSRDVVGAMQIYQLLVFYSGNVQNAFFHARPGGTFSGVNYCLKHGANFKVRSRFGSTILTDAACFGRIDIANQVIQWVRDTGEDVNSFVNMTDHASWSPLMWARRHGHADIVELLKAVGARD